MAIMLKQSRYLQNLRSEILDSKETAILKLQKMVSALDIERADGVQLISRYRSNDKIISLVGIVAVDDNNNSDITIVNAEDAYVTKDEFETAINELKEQINNNSNDGSSGNTEEKDEFGSGYDIDNDYWIHCEYDITNVATNTRLFGSSSDCVHTGCSYYCYDILGDVKDTILAMKIDGVEHDIKISYKFDTLGKHTVDFLLKETTYFPNGMFYKIDRLTKIIIPFSIKTLGHYSLGKCERLTYIQFNSVELPTIKYNAFYQTKSENGLLRIRQGVDDSIIIGEYEKCEHDDYRGGVSGTSGDGDRNIYNKLPITWTVEYIE